MNRIRKYLTIAIAIPYGLLGLTWVFIGIRFVMAGATGKDLAMAAFSLLFLATGLICAVVGYQAIARQNVATIKNLCGLIGLTVFTLANGALRPFADATHASRNMAAHSAVMFAPIVLGVSLQDHGPSSQAGEFLSPRHSTLRAFARGPIRSAATSRDLWRREWD